jgi:predicted negative regulator of RcsB-dependent stress response
MEEHRSGVFDLTGGGKKQRGLFKTTWRKLWLWLVVIAILVAAAAVALYYMNRYQDSKLQIEKLSSQLADPAQVAKAERDKLVSQVSKLTDLPQGETPTIATVTDAAKLKNQDFFVNAENGDKLLIYTKAKKAYLYRPSTNKVINIAPINLGSSSQTNTSSQKQQP